MVTKQLAIAIQTPQNGEGQDDLAIIGLLVVAPQRSATDQIKDDSA
jgi:hypothetical protein